MALAKLHRTFHTLRYLRPRQAFYYLWRRGLGARALPAIGLIPQARAVSINFGWRHHVDIAPSLYHFNFLNQQRHFATDAMQWAPCDVNRLWRYNLHYFDFLHETARPLAEKCALIDDWIRANPIGTAPAWEPYTASLRIVNWSKFFWSLSPIDIQARWLDSLHQQMRWLERNLEFHILANHLMTNIKAMLFAGVYFDDEYSQRWLHRGQQLLCEQLREQTLTDGGHYERSPQYHNILLEDYLDLLTLTVFCPAFQSTTTDALRATAERALMFLQQIQTPDDDIPLFNDSASGSASPPSLIFQRAEQLGITLPMLNNTQRDINLPDSGLFGYRAGDDYLVMDCGDIGPAWQPGHTHCDFLSFVLMVCGQWLIVDSGVCEYEPGELRRYVRSTAAHNTLVIDGADQSEVWGEFRVARRAQRLHAGITQQENGLTLAGAFRGFPTLGVLEHHRTMAIENTYEGKIRALHVKDLVIGRGDHAIASLLHLHPAIAARVEGNRIVMHLSDKIIAVLHTNGFDHIKVTKGRYCPHFGVAVESDVVEMHCHAALPKTCGYTLAVTEP